MKNTSLTEGHISFKETCGTLIIYLVSRTKAFGQFLGFLISLDF